MQWRRPCPTRPLTTTRRWTQAAVRVSTRWNHSYRTSAISRRPATSSCSLWYLYVFRPTMMKICKFRTSGLAAVGITGPLRSLSISSTYSHSTNLFICYSAFQGHPTIFMKILHFALFYSSKPVTNYLYSRDVDPNTIHLNDYTFMERIMFITVSCIFRKSTFFVNAWYTVVMIFLYNSFKII